MGPISSTILDMAKVFELRPSGRCVDVTHNRSSSSCPTAEGLGNFDFIIQLEYTPSTFKSYGTSFVGFIPFAKSTFSPPSATANRDQEHMYFLLYCLNKHVFPK
ncbi:hypothetical protein ACFX15_006614 [Malus domestica]